MGSEVGNRAGGVERDREERQGGRGIRHSVIRGFHIAFLTSRIYDATQT